MAAALRLLASSTRAARPMITFNSRAYATATDKLKLSLVVPHQALISGTEVAQVNIPAATGDMGILSKHEPIIEELRPGVVEVKTLDGQSKKWFISGGFATMHPHNELTVNVVEAAPLEDFSVEAVKANLAEANRVANGSGPEKDKVEARIEAGVLEALQFALKA
ncbi:delta subunit of the central stalk of mitochondrial F1F0 ATP synthase, atp16 [Serendipita sp. 396]|nr:delta subunit of the central stalk of mitochondrial F1F0 ATP synthase, atp16 [Serendipita sp. 396]KAG8789091.1 delta subunit of the central stalk of mitochondrial F1F0 ATP synthase, atp16 [Serendipita sp. 397]KAG8827613.1 delta subunit of the central stalk of mitochondrial F1F0 ATP synthase, atp16 [Serendipita sp. 401]KAG8839626.1 delta subunit of the central stalk of mitochondrial F1F0 ATP synthase, atp16 [Serendipita sp. 400]KAG8860977.1 delta subunit of the central stalk of mitochondrial 